MNWLELNYCGRPHRLEPGAELIFGRAGDLVLDDNAFLHRQMGRISFVGNLWWLTNLGKAIALRVTDKASGSHANVAPGASTPLVFREFWIRLDAGKTTYEIDCLTNIPQAEQPLLDLLPDEDTTVDASSLPLTPDQLLLLLALSEPQLRRGRSASLPANSDVAHRFGWTITKFNRKLDALTSKFARRGVAGLTSAHGRPATGRRQALVDYALSVGLVRSEQLDLLPRGTSPARSSVANSLP